MTRPVAVHRRLGWRAAVAAVAVAGIAGCSQADALAPVGGNRLATVRFAANDVLVHAGVEILVAPTCAATGDAIDCSGTTVDRQPITVASPSRAELTVTVGTAVLYRGTVQDVLDSAARPSG